MAEKRKAVKFMAPAAVAIYPRLNEPDTKFKKEGEYSVKLPFADGEFPAEIIEKCEALIEDLKEETIEKLVADKKGAKAKSISTRPVLTVETDRETGEETGRFTINAKMRASGVSKKTNKPWTRSPDIFDAKGTKLTTPPSIWGGSLLKVAIEAVPYYTPKDNEVGIAFYLEAVQILKLVSGKARDAAAYGFGEEEGGYESTQTFSDATAEADAAGGDGGTAQSGAEF